MMRTILIQIGAQMYVCLCNAITDREIRAAAELGVRTVDDLRETLGVATCCRRCESTARQVLEDALPEHALAAA